MQLNFSGIPRRSWYGRALRAPLKLLPTSLVVPILQGPLRGNRWILGSSNHGCWLGSYELSKQRAMWAAISPGQVVLDVGAHVGFYTLLASRKVGAQGRVVAFEPEPRNLEVLRSHIQINRVSNVAVIAAAVCAATGSARFQLGASSSTGTLSPSGDLCVSAVSLDDLVAAGRIPVPAVIKMDIEGGEHQALLGGRNLLTQVHPVLFLATHGPEVHSECVALLQSYGYAVEGLCGAAVETTDELVAQPN